MLFIEPSYCVGRAELPNNVSATVCPATPAIFLSLEAPFYFTTVINAIDKVFRKTPFECTYVLIFDTHRIVIILLTFFTYNAYKLLYNLRHY